MAFTVIELTVSLSIIGLVAAIAIPAVLQARHASDRMECQNKLRQLGVGFHAAHSTSGAFPTSNHPHGGFVRLLPFLEQHAEYEKMIAGKKASPNAMKLFQCPSDSKLVGFYAKQKGSYYINEGTNFGMPKSGFTLGSATRRDLTSSMVTDGLSNTAAISERLCYADTLRSDAVAEKDRGRYFWWTEARYATPGTEPQAILQATKHRVTALPQPFNRDLSASLQIIDGYNHLLLPNVPGSYNGPEDWDARLGFDALLMPPSSEHTGGVNVLLGDGSVRFIADHITETLWFPLGTKSAGD